MNLQYGVNVHLADNVVLEQMRDAGFKWFRIDFNWYEVEPERNVYDWSRIDRVVDFCNNNKISIYASICYTPSWANVNQHSNINNNYINYYPADNRSDWIDFVDISINKYKDTIKHWGIWNEMNIHFWQGSKEQFVSNIFLPAAKKIKDIDDTLKILGPELSHNFGLKAFLCNNKNWWYNWMKYLLTECGDYFDIITHHIYDQNKGVKLIYKAYEKNWLLFGKSIKKLLKDTKQDKKPFWLTETGWKMKDVRTEKIQSERFKELLESRKSKNYIDNIFIYSAFDDPNPKEVQFGILWRDYSPKESYFTIKDIIT